MKTRFLVVCAFLVLPLSAFALPPERPYPDDCAQPWERPARDASQYEWNGWQRVANNYIECLSDHQRMCYRNAQQFVDAHNELLADGQERIRRDEVTEREVDEIRQVLAAYKQASEDWERAGDGVEKEMERFARNNGVKLIRK